MNLFLKKSLYLMFGVFGVLAIAPVVFAATFPDVPENTVNYNAIEYLKGKGVVSGYPDGTFQPETTINRAEALKIVTLAIGTALDSQTPLPFPDVSDGQWFYQYVRKAFDLKIVEGYPDGTFKPGNNINVAESLKMILLAFSNDQIAAPSSDPYPDVPKDAWYAKYALVCKTGQLIWPQDDGKLHAEREISRGEFAQIVYRFMYIKENNLEKFPLSTDWPTYNHPSEHYSVKYPFGWQRVEAGKTTIFYKLDQENNQPGFERPYQNGAKVVVTVDPNEDRMTFDDYVAKLAYYVTGVAQKLTLNNYPFATIAITDKELVDYYFELPNNSFLAIYTETGIGLNKQQLLEETRNMVGSIRYAEGTTGITDREAFLAPVREKLLVSGAGQDALGYFTELILFDTDTIGIGTGPVDYYYSAEWEVSLKHERDSNTLLAISDGKTSAF
jgi:hypothetical protein